MKSAASSLAPWPASPYIRAFDVVTEVVQAGGEVADDGQRGVAVLGADADPPVPGLARVAVPDEVHRVHQVELAGDVRVEARVVVAGRVPEAVDREVREEIEDLARRLQLDLRLPR
jgi:hypothetical protein